MAIKKNINKKESNNINKASACDNKYNKLQKNIKKLKKERESLLRLMADFDNKQTSILQSVKKLEKKYDMVLNEMDNSDLRSASLEIQEIQMSFNFQYLQLQNQMQQENRGYTAVSNIMKTKHDTVKNSISNVR